MRLAWRNLLHDRVRFAVTIIGIAFSVFLMLLQGSLLAGFVRASSRIIDAAGGDVWLMGRGVSCFECATPLPARAGVTALAVDGVEDYARIAVGQGVWAKPSGRGQLVFLIGADRGVGAGLPRPGASAATGGERDGVMVDRSNTAMLELAGDGAEGELSGLRARLTGIVDDFGSFVGYPYMFTSLQAATRFLRLEPDQAHFLLLHLRPGVDPAVAVAQLRVRLPELDVHTGRDFATISQRYWILQTGAGGAMLLAAFLGFLVGTVIVSQTTYATTMEHIEEFATLKAMGASRGYVRGVVLMQALASAITGAAVGLAVAIPAVGWARAGIPWIVTPAWLPVMMIGLALLMCALAAMLSVRKALAVEPARVFRA